MLSTKAFNCKPNPDQPRPTLSLVQINAASDTRFLPRSATVTTRLFPHRPELQPLGGTKFRP